MSKTITLCEVCLWRICYGSFSNDTFIFSGVCLLEQQSRINSSWHSKEKETKQEKELVASQEQMESLEDETDSLWGTPTIPFQTALPTLISSSRHRCTVSTNTDHPQEYKTALMPHLLKQQDYFVSLDHALNP